VTAAAFVPPRLAERMASPGDKIELTRGQSLYAQRDVAWRARMAAALHRRRTVDAAAVVPLAAGLASTPQRPRKSS